MVTTKLFSPSKTPSKIVNSPCWVLVLSWRKISRPCPSSKSDLCLFVSTSSSFFTTNHLCVWSRVTLFQSTRHVEQLHRKRSSIHFQLKTCTKLIHLPLVSFSWTSMSKLCIKSYRTIRLKNGVVSHLLWRVRTYKTRAFDHIQLVLYTRVRFEPPSFTGSQKRDDIHLHPKEILPHRIIVFLVQHWSSSRSTAVGVQRMTP